MIRYAVLSFALVAGLSGLAATVHARPNYKAALATYVGTPVPARLNHCQTCHRPALGEDQAAVNGRTLNPYGQRLRAVLSELRAAKKRAGIRNRLQAVSDEDADGDGASNVLELLTGHFPGDARDTPNAEERERARQALDAFRARSDR